MSYNSVYTGVQVDNLLALVAMNGTVAKDFIGALVSITGGAQAISAAVPADTVFNTTNFDTNSFTDLGINADRITIPVGVSKVQLMAVLAPNSDLASAQDFTTAIQHFNSGAVLLETYASSAESGHSDAAPQAHTPVIEVSSGDYFKLNILSEGAFVLATAHMSLEYKDGTIHVSGVTLEDAETLVWQGI